MRTWFDELHTQQRQFEQEVTVRQAEREQARQDAKRTTFSLRGVPMVERLKKLIDTMPDEERDKPRHITYFTELMRAKWPTRSGKDQASVSEIGPALKSLGWTRKRKWLGAEQTYKTQWHPPGSTKE